MAKWLHDDVLDGGPDYLYANARAMRVCQTDVTTAGDGDVDKCAVLYGTGDGQALIASITLDAGDFTQAAGDTSGRKITVAAQNSILVAISGSAEHVVLLDSGETTVLAITPVPSNSVTSGNYININAFDIEWRDPI